MIISGKAAHLQLQSLPQQPAGSWPQWRSNNYQSFFDCPGIQGGSILLFQRWNHQQQWEWTFSTSQNQAPSSSYNNYGKYNSYSHNNAWRVVCDVPMVVRISPTLTVSGLRQLLGHQLLHACCFGESKTTLEDNSSNGGDHHNHHVVVETDQIVEFSPEIMNSVMQQVAFKSQHRLQ